MINDLRQRQMPDGLGPNRALSASILYVMGTNRFYLSLFAGQKCLCLSKGLRHGCAHTTADRRLDRVVKSEHTLTFRHD
jgi:hypothetical protein